MSLLPLFPGQSTVQTVLRSWLLSVLPLGVEVVEGQDNEVPEPAVPNFVVMTTTLRTRLETNVDTYQDVFVTGFIETDQMFVSQVDGGTIGVGASVYGQGVAANTTVTSQVTGTGGPGVYQVSPSQVVPGPRLAVVGTEGLLQPTQVTIQLDVHSDVVSTASDMAETIATLFRDDYACTFFRGFANGTIAPLYVNDPHQVPFINAEQQWETRYVVDAVLQVNQTVQVPQEFADRLNVGLIDVDAVYPG